MFYIDLFRCLHTRKVRYLLAGGLAMNLHGVPRMTMDVDLLLALDDANIDGFLFCARELALKPQAPVPLESLKDPDQRRSWIEEKHLIAFGLAPGQPGLPTVDILLRHELDFAAALERALVQRRYAREALINCRPCEEQRDEATRDARKRIRPIATCATRSPRRQWLLSMMSSRGGGKAPWRSRDARQTSASGLLRAGRSQ